MVATIVMWGILGPLIVALVAWWWFGVHNRPVDEQARSILDARSGAADRRLEKHGIGANTSYAATAEFKNADFAVDGPGDRPESTE